jgi:adenosylcobinamide kinase/adenosylcobinamide-phosphate guanylyltransferase
LNLNKKVTPATTLVTGGCRSGKSRHAQNLAEAVPGGRRCYIATCVPLDAEMERRVARHQADRGPEWRTVEEPLEVARSIDKHAPHADVILVDCLTLWISNLMGAGKDMEAVVAAAGELAEAVRRSTCPVVLVTNEVGAGIVPENALARAYRDAAGLVNQTLAAACDRVLWTVAGIPVQIKPWKGGVLPKGEPAEAGA